MTGAAALWPNSLALTLPGQGHDIDPRSAASVHGVLQSSGVTETPLHHHDELDLVDLRISPEGSGHFRDRQAAAAP
jgi:hypothetical protein